MMNLLMTKRTALVVVNGTAPEVVLSAVAPGVVSSVVAPGVVSSVAANWTAFLVAECSSEEVSQHIE